MGQAHFIKLTVTAASGAPAEAVENASRLLLDEFNGHRRGSATFAPAEAPAPGTKALFGISPEILLDTGGIATALIVPIIQHWLTNQRSAVGVCFNLKNEAGEDYVVEIGPNAPPDIVAKLSSAIARATRA